MYHLNQQVLMNKSNYLYGTSPEAVENQVYLALIAYCLLILIQLEMKSKHSLTQIYRWLRVFLWKPSTIMNM
jgi:IS4 transposase